MKELTLAALATTIKELDWSVKVALENGDRRGAATYLQDIADIEDILNAVEAEQYKSATQAYRNLDTAVRDQVLDNAPQGQTGRKAVAQAFGLELLR